MAITVEARWRRLRLVALLAALIGLGVGGYYIARYVEMLVLLSSVVGNHNIVKDSAKNQRGDKVEALTEFSGRWQDPDKTIVRLRRAHHWFSTTLVETDSFGVQEHLAWRNNRMLDVTLGFGCLVHQTQPIEQIGSVQISYHFSNGDKTLSKGCPD